MNDSNKEAVTTLNNLIEYCKDGQKGYQTAAEDVGNQNLKDLFRTYAQQRSDFVGELKEQVRVLGGDPDSGGSVTGAVHRSFIDLKSALSKGDEEAVLSECDRGDSAAEAKYDEALKHDLPMSVRNIVKHQHDEIRNARNQIRSLKERMD